MAPDAIRRQRVRISCLGTPPYRSSPRFSYLGVASTFNPRYVYYIYRLLPRGSCVYVRPPTWAPLPRFPTRATFTHFSLVRGRHCNRPTLYCFASSTLRQVLTIVSWTCLALICRIDSTQSDGYCRLNRLLYSTTRTLPAWATCNTALCGRWDAGAGDSAAPRRHAPPRDIPGMACRCAIAYR